MRPLGSRVAALARELEKTAAKYGGGGRCPTCGRAPGVLPGIGVFDIDAEVEKCSACLGDLDQFGKPVSVVVRLRLPEE